MADLTDILATTGTTATVTINDATPDTHTLETSGDHDWLRVNLTAGQTYVFYINPSEGTTLTDSVLNLLDSTGAVIASNDDRVLGTNTHSLYSAITYTATTTGTYYLDAAAYGTGTGDYVVGGTTVPATDVAATTATTSILRIGATTGSAITSGDHDWFKVTLVAGETYTFRVDPQAGTTLTDSFLTLRDAAGVEIVHDDDGAAGLYSTITFTAATSGTYFLDVSGYGTAAGDYLLTALNVPTPVPLTDFTYDQIADQLINGYWEFNGGVARHFNVTQGGHISVNITALTADGQNLATEALALWHDITGIIFDFVNTAALITFDDNQSGAFANSVTSGGFIQSSTVNVDTQWLVDNGTALDSYSFQTYIHEIGHALGLGHAGNYNGSADYGTDNHYLNDVWSTTIMSYFSQTENTEFAALGFDYNFVMSPMIADVLAMSQMYGLATNTRTGATTYGFNSNAGRATYDATLNPDAAYAVFDSAGIDTLDYSGYAQNQLINLNQETFSNVGGHVGNVSIVRGTVIENAYGGTGNDTIEGNTANNKLYGGTGADSLNGGAGNDWLQGQGGADTLNGGTGNDVYFIDASDTISETGGNGTADEVRASFNYTLLTGFEVLRMGGTAVNGTGNSAGNQLIGNATGNLLNGMGGADSITGGGGNDTINGGTGVDTLLGGDGNDLITGGTSRDVMTGNAGADRFIFANGDFGGKTLTTADTITDFVHLTDRIDLSAVDANTGVAGDQAFSFIGSAAFTGAAGQVRAYSTGGATPHTIIEINTNADTVVDYWIVLDGTVTITGSDFTL